MKTIDIIGDNYFGKWDRTRTACRGIVIRDGRLLLSYETSGRRLRKTIMNTTGWNN